MESDYARKDRYPFSGDPIQEQPGALTCKQAIFLWKALEAEDVEDAVGGDGDALVAVDGERHGIGDNAAAGLKVPQRLSRARIERVEVTFVGARENQAPGGGEYAGPRRRVQLEFPAQLSGLSLQRFDRAPSIVGRQLIFAAASKKGGGLVRRVALEIACADFARGHVDETGLRIVGRTEPHSSAIRVGPDKIPFLGRFGIGDRNGPALGVEALGPALLRVRLAGDEFAGRAIEHIVKRVAVGDGDELALCAADLRVE